MTRLTQAAGCTGHLNYESEVAMRREISGSTMFAAAPKVTVVLTFDSTAEEETFLRALAQVDEMAGPSTEIAALNREELAALINSGPMDSIEDMVRWDMARREWMCREGEWVALYKETEPGRLVPVGERKKSLDFDWVVRVRNATTEEG